MNKKGILWLTACLLISCAPAAAQVNVPAGANQEADVAAQHNLRGLEYAASTRYREAAEEFEKAAELDPRLPEAQYNLGVMYAQLGRHWEAVHIFGRALD